MDVSSEYYFLPYRLVHQKIADYRSKFIHYLMLIYTVLSTYISFYINVCIQWFFDTVVEFTKLERIEFSGLKGRLLSARITEIYSDFNEQFSLFSSKTYDVLEPEDERFEIDYEQFKESIKDLDHRLAFTLSQAFDDCYNLDGVFKVYS